MTIRFRSIFPLIMAACMAAAAPGASADSAYPSQRLTLVVGFSAGSSIDQVARQVAKNLEQKIGQPVVVENRSGAGGNLAADHVARSKPDGYTLLVVANSIAVSPALYKNLKFDVEKDLVPVAYIGIGPVVLKVNKALNIDSLEELIAYAKANPGKLNYGSSGVGGTPHMATVLFEEEAGIKMTHIPYKGGADALAALMGGQIDVLINPLLGDTNSDKVMSLAITGEERSALAPDVPTFKELGYGNYDIGVYYGIMGPRDIPASTVVKINQSINSVLDDKDVVEALSVRSGIVLEKMTPAQFQDYLNKDIKRWKQVVAKNHIVVE